LQHHFPGACPQIAAACAERGVRFLDAPVTGGDWGAKKGELIFMVGGDADTVKAVEPILSVMGKKWFTWGPMAPAKPSARDEPDPRAPG